MAQHKQEAMLESQTNIKVRDKELFIVEWRESR